ncbi:nose resistant to fluoxetine protein 6-like [Manduca sexta]|uniref:nose resistant to fluoxetine protein 6-like n=1 Tax=Manduca sexta TaxID=7130 RepID=UPI00188EE4A1|nr:nose resistant to fluoxetine protein 6-like [Manduca sexta]
MFTILITMFLFWRGSYGVIYNLNDTEYEMMPPLFKLDEYAPCISDPGGLYCVVDIDLFSRHNSSLMRMIQGYSEHRIKHYNHTQIHRGICVTRTCRHNTTDLTRTVQECANESLWENYKIEGRVNIQYCKGGERPALDKSDLAVALVYLVLIILNITGSVYDVVACKDGGKGNPYLLAFSLKRNWARLVAAGGKGDDPRFERLKLFQGIRSITMVLVIFSHTVLIMAYSYVDNPQFIERSYEDPLKQLLYNGSLVTHSFFVMSAFLLAYNFQIYNEKHKTSWVHFPKGILLRWLRLTPTYALMLATIATLMRHLGDGPLWEHVVTSEANACRSYWWAHLLFINNYIYDDAFCLPQTWYLAADTQMFCVGLLVCVLARGPKARKIALSVLFCLSLIIPALQTYYQDLNAVVIQSPESYRNLYAHDHTFRLLYIRGHTNLSTYTIGLAGGYLIYSWQKEGRNFDKVKKYPWVIWLLFPLGVGIILSGGVFYIDGISLHPAWIVLYAALYKPLFQLCIIGLTWGCIFKIESIYRGIVEWRGFTWTGRVSYSAFFTHTLFQRGLIGIQTIPSHITEYGVMCFLCASLFLSFVTGAALWLCVEAPAAALVRATLRPKVSKSLEAGENRNSKM